MPVIAKADSFKPLELGKMKEDIIITAGEKGIKFFNCQQAIFSLFVRTFEESEIS